MAIEKPSLSELDHRIRTDINDALNTQQVTHNVHDKLASALAGLTYGLYNYIDIISRQISPIEATGIYLDRWFSLFNIVKKSASKATGFLLVPVLSSAITLPKETVFSTKDGLQYQTTSINNLSTSTTTVIEVESISTGYKYNLVDGTILTSTSLAGVITHADNIGSGADVETIEDMRSRLLQRIRYGNNSGSQGDYVNWATSVTGVKRAWCPGEYTSAGYVNVFIASASKRNPSVNKQLVQAVESELDKYRPMGVKNLFVYSVKPMQVDFLIRTTALITDQQKLNIETLLADYIYSNYELNDAVDQSDFEELLDSQIYNYNTTIHQGNLACLGIVRWI